MKRRAATALIPLTILALTSCGEPTAATAGEYLASTTQECLDAAAVDPALAGDFHKPAYQVTVAGCRAIDCEAVAAAESWAYLIQLQQEQAYAAEQVRARYIAAECHKITA